MKVLYVFKRRQIQYAFILFFLLVNCSYASSFLTGLQEIKLRPIAAVAYGASSSTDIGESQYIPITNPVEDQYYDYSADYKRQTTGLVDVFAGAEWTPYPDWLAQAGFDYNQAAPFTAKGMVTQGDYSETDTYPYHYTITTHSFLVLAKVLYTIKDRFHPYILGGLGASFNKAYDYDATVPPTLTFTRMYKDGAGTYFSYAVGLGIDADINSHMRVGVGYRFADLGQVKLGQTMIDTSVVSGTRFQSHLYSNQLLAQLTLIV